MHFLRTIAKFWLGDDRGQDLAEYCLITALIALIAFGIFWHVSGGIQGVGNSMTSTLTTANSSAHPVQTGGTNGN